MNTKKTQRYISVKKVDKRRMEELNGVEEGLRRKLEEPAKVGWTRGTNKWKGTVDGREWVRSGWRVDGEEEDQD